MFITLAHITSIITISFSAYVVYTMAKSAIRTIRANLS